MKKLFGIVSVLAAAAPSIGSAAMAGPGMYQLDGGLELCLKADSTWHSPNSPSWGGQWGAADNLTFVFGKAPGGPADEPGHISLVVKRNGSATRTYWNDTFVGSDSGVSTVVKTSDQC